MAGRRRFQTTGYDVYNYACTHASMSISTEACRQWPMSWEYFIYILLIVDGDDWRHKRLLMRVLEQLHNNTMDGGALAVEARRSAMSLSSESLFQATRPTAALPAQPTSILPSRSDYRTLVYFGFILHADKPAYPSHNTPHSKSTRPCLFLDKRKPHPDHSTSMGKS